MPSLSEYGLEWDVIKSHGIKAIMPNGDESVYSGKYNALVRGDNHSFLGVVGNSYQVIQNSELLALAERIEPLGFNICNGGEFDDGKLVFIQLSGASRQVGSKGDDVVEPYFLLFNGHDGLRSMEGLPTSIRVFCKNSLNMAISDGRRKGMTITIKHTGDIGSKIEALYEVVERYYVTRDAFFNTANELASKDVNRDWLQNFWANVYSELYDDIVQDNPNTFTTDTQMRRYMKAKSTMLKWSMTWDREYPIFGANRWIALNSATNWVDHDTQFRGEGKEKRRIHSNLLGINAKNKARMLELALA